MNPILPPLPRAAHPVTAPANLVGKLLADIDARKKELAALEKGEYGVRPRNRRYVADIDWNYKSLVGLPNPPYNGGNGAGGFFSADNPALAPYDQLSAPFTVDQGTKFFVKSISFALIAVGTIPATPGSGGPNIAANVVIPAVMRAVNYGYGAVNFRWKVRSTGSDRDWQNQFLPDWLLLSGSRNGLRFRRAQYCLVGGSEVNVTVAPVRSALEISGVAGAGLSSVDSLRFQFVFGGVEVDA